MRRIVRPLVMCAVLASWTAALHSQERVTPLTLPGENILEFAVGSPSALQGGVSVGLIIRPTTGWTCTEVTIAIVDQNAQTLASQTINNPGATLTQNFTGLASGINVDVQVTSTFQNGAQFDFPSLEGNVTTQ